MKNTYRCVVANMEMIEFNKDLLEELLAAARRNPRLRQGRDMRTSEADSSQRMLNAGNGGGCASPSLVGGDGGVPSRKDGRGDFGGA